MENNQIKIEQSAERKEIEPNVNQQNKLINYIKSGDHQIFSRSEVRASFAERQDFLEDINSGKINDINFREALSVIASPIEPKNNYIDSDSVYAKISENGRIKGVIAQFIKRGMNQGDNIGPQDLKELYKIFPDPIVFEHEANYFISKLAEKNTSETVSNYNVAIEQFKNLFYGKKYDYFKQIKILKNEAYILKKFTNQIEAKELDKNGLENNQIEIINEDESQKILEEAEINGSEYQGKFLTKEVLKKEGLSPKYKIQMDDSVVCLSSNAYWLTGGRIGITAYVEKEGKTIVNSFYRSNSQGIWRYMPNYKASESDGSLEKFGKGYSEESVILPIILQKALTEIVKDADILEVKDPYFIISGTVPGVVRRSDDYYMKINKEPKVIINFNIPESEINNDNYKVPPEQLQIPENVSPNFQKLLASWEQETSLYGNILTEVYASKDGKLKYMFCKDQFARAWISGIEDNSEVQSMGLRKSWVAGYDLTTPAFEYKNSNANQTGGYGNESFRTNNYVDMFQNYLSKIPVIQEYLDASLGRLPLQSNDSIAS